MPLDFLLPHVIAHRGASAYAPENTLTAMKKAAEMGATMVEFDVMLTGDGEAIVIHDESLKRTTNGRGEVGELRYADIATLDAGSWFSPTFKDEKIPLLTEMFDCLKRCNLAANIEIKPYPGKTKETAEEVVRLIQTYWPDNLPLPLISSFDWSALTIVHELAPTLPLGLLMEGEEKNWKIIANEHHCKTIHMDYKSLSPHLVADIKSTERCVLAYTVNNKTLAEKLFSWGVDAVFSDYPDLIF